MATGPAADRQYASTPRRSRHAYARWEIIALGDLCVSRVAAVKRQACANGRQCSLVHQRWQAAGSTHTLREEKGRRQHVWRRQLQGRGHASAHGDERVGRV